MGIEPGINIAPMIDSKGVRGVTSEDGASSFFGSDLELKQVDVVLLWKPGAVQIFYVRVDQQYLFFCNSSEA